MSPDVVLVALVSGGCAAMLLWRWTASPLLGALLGLVVALTTWDRVPGDGTAIALGVAAAIVTTARWRATATEHAAGPPGPATTLVTMIVVLVVALGISRLHGGAGWPWLLSVIASALVATAVIGARDPAARATAWTGAAAFVVAAAGPGWALVAAVLALLAMLRSRPPQPAPQVDDVDRATLLRYAADRGDRPPPDLAPVVILIAAYREADGLPDVLARLPERVGGLATDVVVVDDGSDDGTAEVAAATRRAHVLRCPRNRGQGAALRLGYRFARDHGARFVITTDADGQYDVDDMAAVLAPVAEGWADFSTGSRTLGAHHTRDRVRRIGSPVFAWLVTLLTGRRITDTSFGLRAMRAEVTGAVVLDQPQYQSSELLIGLLARGFRVAEVPATLHARSNGSTKKGRNLVYGRRYAGVVLGTWWREYVRGARTSAPALRNWARHEPATATTAHT